MDTTIRLGISACLLGQRVRYDGGHKLDRFLKDTLGEYIEYVPVCPEVECGLSVPRDPLRLVGNPEAPRLVTILDSHDYTARMTKWARIRLADLKKREISGFIFKSNSPSCGLQGVKILDEKNSTVRRGRGIFAGLFVKHFPLIPAEDQNHIHNRGQRDDFFDRVFTLKRWRKGLLGKRTLGKLIAFHESHRLLILSHSQRHLAIMERVLKTKKSAPVDELYPVYQDLLVEALKLKTTPRKNVRAFHRAVGYLGKGLAQAEKQELMETTGAYGKGHVPRLVPTTLINHYARKCRCHDLDQEVFLHPHPIELHLRNHA